MTEHWGILMPDDLGSLRRQQNLGLASAVRHFNDRSVPGLGGMWFPMPLVWSVLAVALAETRGVAGPAAGVIQLANAIEALAMSSHDQGATGRSRGARKLNGNRDKTFTHLAKRGTYVTQPLRMGMAQPLRELGYVTGNRFGTFRLDRAGERIMELPAMQDWVGRLRKWVEGKDPRKLDGLSPFAPLPADIRKNIRRRIETEPGPGRDDAARRRALMAFGKGPDRRALEEPEAPGGLSPDHWADMRAGAAFIDLRDTALAVLRYAEGELLKCRNANEPLRLDPATLADRAAGHLDRLREDAGHYAARLHTAEERQSIRFAEECRTLSPQDLLRRLAERDNSVIAIRYDMIVPGPAAGDLRPDHVSEDDEVEAVPDPEFAPQLYRLRNLHGLMAELDGRENPKSPGYPQGTAP